jgi:parvulin-like peptidyl-prolyl isomerase
MRIPQAELEQRSQQAALDYKGRTGTELPPEVMPLIRRQLLESLIRRDLLVLEAQRRGIIGSEQEAEAQLKTDPFFQVNGRFSPERYAQAKLQNPAAVADALQGLRLTLGARDLMQRLQAEKGPKESELRARGTRALTRASFDYLVLRRDDFDGGFTEPRETDVIDHYRAHLADYHRPARATFTAVFVDQPALSDSAAAIPSAVAAWTARMRQGADSVIAALAAGRTIEEASQAYGGPHPKQVVLLDNFPGYWQGGPESKAAVFSARPGSVLPQPVPAQKGWLVVRVDEVQLAHSQPLAEVARDIRSQLRSERRATQEEHDLRALYAEMKDSLMVTGYRLRYALADTADLDPGSPTPAEIDRYYRSHLADYSSFSSQSGGVVAKTLEEVRGEVVARLQREHRLQSSRGAAEALLATWARGRRDAATERRLRLRDVGPLPIGVPVEPGPVGAVLTDSLTRRQGALGRGLARTPRGWIAFDLYQEVPGYLPSFEEARPRLARIRAERRLREEEEGARRLFDASPLRFAEGPIIRYTRAFVPIPSVLTVHLTRAEVERYHREHMDRFTAPELVRARHILISPRDASPEADREAKARADSLLERLRAGEDFATVATRVSDDPATRENGGDLGLFGRGAMLQELERAAFAMRPGDLSTAPVKTAVGYHLIKAREYVPMVAQPLPQIYADVAEAAAREKADSLAMQRADSLLLYLRTAAQAREAARRLDLVTLSYDHVSGDRSRYPQDLHLYYQNLEKLKPGQLLSLRPKLAGMGYAVTWVDSIAPPGVPVFEKARDRAVEAYRSEAGLRALDAKRAELDSLMQAGWSFDSLGVAWGGLLQSRDVTPGQRIVGIGVGGAIDTLIFGLHGNDGLEAGRLSDWLVLPAGATRVRGGGTRPPDANALTTHVVTERRAETERALVGYFEELKQRYPVRILDRKLRDVSLPQPPPR